MKTTLILVLLLLCSCEKWVTWDRFSLQKKPFVGSQLKTDGYYYQLAEDGTFQRLYCFYRNGVLLDLGGTFKSKVEMDAYIHREFLLDRRFANQKYAWGLFDVALQTIKLEHYYPGDELRKRAYVREGTILNDSTFHVTISYRSDGSERGVQNEIYHFRQFRTKPDSTNSFIR